MVTTDIAASTGAKQRIYSETRAYHSSEMCSASKLKYQVWIADYCCDCLLATFGDILHIFTQKRVSRSRIKKVKCLNGFELVPPSAFELTISKQCLGVLGCHILPKNISVGPVIRLYSCRKLGGSLLHPILGAFVGCRAPLFLQP